jgi:hypothetical protein
MNASRTPVGLRRLTAVALAFTATLAFASSDAYAQRRRAPQTFNVVPITVASVTPQDGQLVANLLVGSHLVPVPLALSVPQDQQALQQGACPILNLSLGPIDLNLLGLGVGTSPICLRVTAIEGGGLLGDLLCSIAGLLSQGQPLADVLGSLTEDQLDTLNYGLTQVLNQAVFIPLTSTEAVTSATCSVLHLELGPLDLNLLGLRVELDDCAAGPVVLDVTADPEGGLLGDLLCGLSNLLNNNRPNQTPPVLNLLRDIAAAIGRIWG